MSNPEKGPVTGEELLPDDIPGIIEGGEPVPVPEEKLKEVYRKLKEKEKNKED